MKGIKVKYYYKVNNKYMNILNTTIEEFMKYNPPCKECLIQSMCLTEYEYNRDKVIYYEVNIRVCERIKGSIKNNNIFNNTFKDLYERTE